jgi:parvulin-like peptidyl-prolyl isomerase
MLDSRADAKRAFDRVARGEPFEKVAREMSIDKASADRGGSLGEVTDPQLAAYRQRSPAVADAIATAKPGKLFGPLDDGESWHVLRCGPKVPASPATLESVRPALAARMREERSRASVESLVADLRGRAKVELARR